MRVRPFGQALVVGMGIGALFSSFYAVARPDRAAQILSAGAMTGAFISVAIHVLEHLLARAVDRLPMRRR